MQAIDHETELERRELHLAISARDQFAFVAIIVVVLTGLAVLSSRGLFADGSYYLLRILEHERFFSPAASRVHIDWLTQAPVLAAIALGLRDLDAFRLLYSSGLFVLPAAVWLAALYKVKDDGFFWPFVLLFTLVFFATNVMAVGNFNAVHALTGLAMAVLLRRQRVAAADAWLLAAIAAVLTRSYETVFFLAPMLGLMTLVRLPEALRESRAAAAGMAVTLVLLGIATLVAAYYIVNPVSPANFTGARDMSIIERNDLMRTGFVIGALYLATLVAFGHRLGRLAACLLAAPALFYLWGAAGTVPPIHHHESRVVAGLFLFGCGLALLAMRVVRLDLRLTNLSFASTLQLAAVPLVVLLLFATVDVGHSERYASFLRCFDRVVDSGSGLRPVQSTILSSDTACHGEYGWSWTYPTTSILLRDSDSGRILVNEGYGGWQPFDPSVSYPDLSRYYR